MSARALASIFAAAAAVSALACSDLRRAENVDPLPGGGGTTGSGPDGGQEGDGGAEAGSDAGDDAGAPPVDFECDDPWVAPSKTKAECSPRQVKVVEADAPIDVTGIAIARTPAGRVGIVYNAELDGQSGEMHLAHFVPSSPSFTPQILKRAKGGYDHAGYLVKIAASGPDVLHVLAHDVDDVTSSGEVVVVKLVGGAAPLTDPEVVIGGVKRPSEIALAVDDAGATYATVRISTGQGARLAAFKKPSGGSFAALPDLTSALLPDQAPGTGAASLVAAAGQVHLLDHHCETMSHSTPRYHTLDGPSWSFRKTVDNAIVDGLSGYSPSLGVFGARKTAAYFFRKASQGLEPKAELRVATWRASGDTPTIEIVAQGLRSDDPLYPPYRAAVAVDRWGLVHLASIEPTGNMGGGVLVYRRQTRLDGGGTKWLSDRIDPDVASDVSSSYVDLLVDEAGRPHVAYRSGKDGKARCGTRRASIAERAGGTSSSRGGRGIA